MIHVKSLLCISLLLFLLSCKCEKEGVRPEDLKECFYSVDVLNNICPDASCDSIRFYNARYFSNSDETLMAIGVEEGGDKNNNPYYYFRKIGDAGPKYTRLSAARAKRRSLKPNNDDRYAVTFSKAELLGLIEDETTEGITFVHAWTIDRYNTLEAYPAILDDTDIIIVNRGPIVVDHPCPIYCGTKPNDDYIWGTDLNPAGDDKDPRDKDG